MDAEASPSLLPFALVILASLSWVILVGFLLPRLLGRTLSFVANRFFHDASHISIPSLYIYPLSGRIVAHSLRYTIPNGTVSVEELVLQCRWWRKVHEVHFRQLLTVDDPQTLDPLAAEQQITERENAAFLSFWYRLRRWWHRTAVTTDPNNSVEPRPLISLICVGLRARIVNDRKNYAHVNKVLTLARATARRSAQFDRPVPTELHLPLTNDASSHLSGISADINDSPATSSTYLSVESVDGKPWQQRVLEFLSLRISDGAFYFCDMGQSPLVRLTVNSAKLRYRYGAAACSADECRKRILVRVSGLKLSVSSRNAVDKVVRMTTEPSSDSTESSVDQEEAVEESNTDRMIRRIMLLGHRGFTPPGGNAESQDRGTSKEGNESRRRAQNVLPRISNIDIGRQRIRMARIPQVLPCSDVMNATTAIIDYVFDEPGFERPSKDAIPDASNGDNRQVGSSDTYEKLPAPVCRVSILLRGGSFSYDFQAVADIERVIERFQPVFYDLRSLARKIRSGEAKRSADGIQIEIEATPKIPEEEDSSGTATPLLKLPFIPKQSTWRGLLAMNLRRWSDESEMSGERNRDENALPQSQLAVLASRITFRTEVPYHVGVAQKSVLSMDDVAVNAEGVVDMPLGSSKTISFTRIIHYPMCWKDEHTVTSDVQVSDAEFLYLPDTFRVLGDISTTIQTLSRKPESVRYFVPFRETIRIFAAQGYRVILSCAHDNAWQDIHTGEADHYGRMIVRGENGELVLSPNAATEFVQDSTVLSWSLSLPNAVGQLDFSLPRNLSVTNSKEKITSGLEWTDPVRSGHHKSRASSLAQFMKSLETFGGHSHHSSVPVRKTSARHFGIEMLRAGKSCKLSGKALVHERHVFLGTTTHAFLDSVNRSEIHFRTSSLQLDLNPHHVTHILNFVRNYTGPGLHTISTNEGSLLTQQRLNTARRVLMEGRFPTATECLIVGLPAGVSLGSQEDRTALDDVLCVTFQSDRVLVRLHDQPHAFSTFHADTRDACSLECRNLSGSLSSNRQGVELSCLPDSNKNLVSLREGYRELQEDVAGRTQTRHIERMVPPTATIANLRITKRSWANEEFSSYHSELKIDIGEVSGCVSDTSVARISHFASQLVPDALHEDSMAVAAMLSVENIEVQLSKLDLLILSASSTLSADLSGQMNKPIPSERFARDRRTSPSVNIPKFLSGVSQVQLPVGLRYVISNLALEDIATRSRILIPDIAMDVLIPWGGKLIPWVDDLTMRAQVAHAVLLKDDSTADGFRDAGLLRRVAEARDITVDLSYDTRPLLWSTRISRQQRIHIARMRRQLFTDSLPWCSADHGERERQWSSSFDRRALKRSWWSFLDGACKASNLEKHVNRKSRISRHLDYLSVSIVTNAVIFITPESLEIANDIFVRSKEAVSFHSRNTDSTTTGSAERTSPEFSVSDIMQLWREFERTRKVPLLAKDAKPLTSMKAIETKGLAFILTSPLITGRGRDLEPFLSSRHDTDQVKFSAPVGISFLHLTKADVPKLRETGEKRDERVAGFPKTTLVCANHVSIPTVEVRCNGQEFIDLSGMVFISQRTTKTIVANEMLSRGEVLHPQVRNSRVGRVAGLRIGARNSALHSYACFGRVLSIFVLLSRALRLEASALSKQRMKRMEELCELLFSSTKEKLRDGDPQAVRNFFVQAIHYLRSSEDERAGATQRGALISDQFCIPSHVLKNVIIEEGNSSHRVDSIDASIRNFSLKAANHAVVDGDFFQCKGGFRSESDKPAPQLAGHVLNASLGTIWLSVRDDTASDALRMVSEVASFVRAAAFSIPTMRYDVHGRKQGNIESSDLLSFSYTQPKGSDVLKAGPGPSVRQGRSLRGSSLGNVNRRRQIYSSHQRGSWRGRSSLRWRGMASSDETDKSDQSARHSWLRSVNSRPPTKSGERLPSMKVPLNDQLHLAPEVNESPMKRRKGLSQAAAIGSAALSSGKDLILSKNEAKDAQAPIRVHRRDFGGDGVGRDERYSYIAVRTAGESGPPRKRAKFMIRVGTVVPPAFEDTTALVSPRKKAPEFGSLTENAATPRSFSDRNGESQPFHQGSDPTLTATALNVSQMKTSDVIRTVSDHKEDRRETSSSVTLFVSCHKIACHYFRGKRLQNSMLVLSDQEADIRLLISDPRLTYMSSPQKGSHSVVITSSSAELQSANDPNCVLTGSIGKIGLTMSVAQGYVPSTLPKLIMSAQLSEFTTTLHATDLQSVLTFRERFKKDIKGILSAFVRTKQSISEMARATRLSSYRVLYPGRTVYATLAFDLLCERSKIKLEGFHPKDSEMTVSYLLDGMFFSVVASEDDNALLTLGLRLYGHGLSLASPSWESTERLHFPSFDARGVQWGEATGLPTILKVTAEPLINSTSVQGLRHVLFTVAGLMAFQNVTPDVMESDSAPLSSVFLPRAPTATHAEKDSSASQIGGTPFTRSFVAWERTRGVRMDISIRPMSLSLVSGQVLALFDVDTITGIFEWNKLVLTGVQLHMAVGVPRISLSFMRMASSEFTIAEISPSEKRTSMSIALERSRIDLLKTQEDLTHTFTFRIDVFAVSGQVRPWKLLLDAASWADEQEFVAELQAINYSSLSSARRLTRAAVNTEAVDPVQHRVILIGAKVQRFILAVPLLSTEEYSSSRLALRATELHCLSRQRFQGTTPPAKNVMQLKTHFIGILWENSPLLSTHHARIAFSVKRPSFGSTAHFGDTSVVMYPGTWRICPRKDVVVAIIEAKNRKDNKKASEKTRELLAALPDMAPYPASSTAGDSVSYATEKQNRLLFESISLKTFRTSGFLEGLDRSTQSSSDPHGQTSTMHDQAQQISKLSVPAFSVSVVRRIDRSFDIVDVDFSGREGGDFPRGCLGKVSNLFTDLFGAVTADQVNEPQQDESVAQIQHSRDVSVLIRFGKSLYRAQEEVSAMEAKFGFFAGKSSSLLISLYTSKVLEGEGSHSTVITGILPRLGLEITPLLSGAKVQSLRLTDARFLHGISPSCPPHTMMHINRVTALMEAKTLLLTRNRLGSLVSVKSTGSDSGSILNFSSSMVSSERKLMFLLGKARLQRTSFENDGAPEGKEYRVEPDIRLQMKFPANNETSGDEVDLFVERCIFGTSADRPHPIHHSHQVNAYAGFHKVILRAQWDLLGCKLQLREALLCYDISNIPISEGGLVSMANIINRLQFESMQYGRNTAKVDIDAVAAMWAVPTNELLLESTSVHAEIAYTLQNAKTKLTGQAKKLRNEVRLLTEKDLSREPRRGGGRSYESNTLDSALNGKESLREMDPSFDYMSKTSGPRSSRSGGTLGSASVKDVKPRTRNIVMKGDELVVTMRGYQFDEAQQSAEMALSRYDLRYRCGFAKRREGPFQRYLDIDFDETRLSYVDEDRGISSDLFRIPNPKLNLSIIEDEDITNVDLQGVLLIALKHGFYYIQDFRNLAELTIMGIAHAPVSEKGEAPQKPETDQGDSKQIWNGKQAKVTVNLNPKIDVMGDLTEDMLHMNMISSRLGKAEVIPRQMYDFVIVPLEVFSNALCDPLYK